MKNEFPETYNDLIKAQTFNLGITLHVKLKALRILEKLEANFNQTRRA